MDINYRNNYNNNGFTIAWFIIIQMWMLLNI